MAAFGTAQHRPLRQRGPAVGFRFFLYSILAIALMFLDQRGGWLERVRYALQAVAYPLQLAANSPSAAWHWIAEQFESREALQQENAAMRAQRRLVDLQLLRTAAVERENLELRQLRKALPPLISKSLVGEVISVESSTLRQRLVINRGSVNGVFKGQTVVSGGGVLGQTLRVGPWSSEVILVTDPENAIPVQVVRNGLRTIAVGSGESSLMTLPYLPIQSDIVAGDRLVTSGLGGVFPAGFPVAQILEVKRDGNSALAQVHAVPTAALDRDRVVMFVWFDASHPAAPASAAAVAPVTTGTDAVDAATRREVRR